MMLKLDNMGGRGVSGTSDWTTCRIEMVVDEEANQASFGPIFPGKGTAWFDDLVARYGELTEWLDAHMDALTAAWADEMYTVGLYCGRGRAAKNDRSVYRVPDPTEGTLSAVLEQALLAHAFIDLGSAPVGAGTAWMDTGINGRQWGTGAGIQVLRAQYDALLYIDEVRPPVYR